MQISPESKLSPSRIIAEIFSKPVDLFDFFLENNFSLVKLLLIYISLSSIALVSKIINNYIQIRFSFENAPTRLTEGIIVVALVYIIFLLGIFFLENFTQSFLIRIGKQYEKNFVLVAFLPVSASSIFWIFPKIILVISIVLSFSLAFYNLQEGLKNLYELNKKQLWAFIFALGIFLGILLFLILAIANFYKNL